MKKLTLAPHDFGPFGDGWIAYDDATSPDGEVGHGSDKIGALKSLLWQVDYDDAAVAVIEDEIKKLEEPAHAEV